MEIPKKVLTFHDICTLGRCSTVTATAVLASCGIQPCPLVSSILSSTVDFGRFSSMDTIKAAEDALPFIKEFGGHFDAVYTGYLADPGQVETVQRLLALFRKADTPVIIDPVMADDGALYPTFDGQMVQAMQRLTKSADLILPNETEARLLCGLKTDTPLTPQELFQLAGTLSSHGRTSVIITGIHLADNRVGNLCLPRSGAPLLISHPYLLSHFPGSGDLFSSVVTAMLVKGSSVAESCLQACAFLVRLLKEAQGQPLEPLQGLPYEPYLPLLRHPLPLTDLTIKEITI